MQSILAQERAVEKGKFMNRKIIQEEKANV
jgi:hypothetical protein